MRNGPVDTHAARMREAFGFRRARGWACPRRFAGRGCDLERGRMDCECQRHHGVLDHGRVWRDTAGVPVLTGEPYGLSGDALLVFLRDMAALGLEVWIDATSPW